MWEWIWVQYWSVRTVEKVWRLCTFPECLQKCINRAKPKAKSQKVRHEEEVLKTGTDTSEQLRGEQTGIKSELDSGDGKWRSMWDCLETSCRPLVVVLLNIHATVKDTWKYAGSDDYCLKQTWAEMNLKEENLIEVQYFYLYVSSSDLQRNTALFFKIQYYFWFCFIYICRLTWHVRVESVYHEWVMDGSHVLRLGHNMIDMFHWCRVVKNADLQRRDKHRYSGKSRWTIRRRHGVNDKERKRKMRRITKNKSTWREGRD